MKGIRGDWKFSAKAGCHSLAFQSRPLCVFVMDMVILAPSSLKVCHCVCFSENVAWFVYKEAVWFGEDLNFCSGIARRIAASGYGVFAMDYPGFGLSEGLHGYIPNFNNLVDDVIEHYTKIKGVISYLSVSMVSYWLLLLYCSCENTWCCWSCFVFHLTARPDLRGLPRFMLGQSMGGAVSLKVHLKEPNNWDGVVLVAPMCKVSSFLLCIVIDAHQLHCFNLESPDSAQKLWSLNCYKL